MHPAPAMGGTVVEPNVLEYKLQLNQVKKIIKLGFPKENIVIRIDPIILTQKGLERVRMVLEYIQSDIKRFRVSVIDMYPHTRDRFKNAGISVPFNGNFQASKAEFIMLDEFLQEMKSKYDIIFESCSETNIKETEATGCVSKKDLEILNLNLEDHGLKGQRKTCLCLSCKTELLEHKGHKNGYGCEYQCLYCYWK